MKRRSSATQISYQVFFNSNLSRIFWLVRLHVSVTVSCISNTLAVPARILFCYTKLAFEIHPPTVYTVCGLQNNHFAPEIASHNPHMWKQTRMQFDRAVHDSTTTRFEVFPSPPPPEFRGSAALERVCDVVFIELETLYQTQNTMLSTPQRSSALSIRTNTADKVGKVPNVVGNPSLDTMLPASLPWSEQPPHLESNTSDKLKKAQGITWNVLETALRLLEKSPLSSQLSVD